MCSIRQDFNWYRVARSLRSTWEAWSTRLVAAEVRSCGGQEVKHSPAYQDRVLSCKTYIVPVLMYGCGIYWRQQSICVSTDFTRGLSVVCWGFLILVMYRTRKSGQCQHAEVRAVWGCVPVSDVVIGAPLKILWSHCMQCSQWRPPRSCCCGVIRTWLETTLGRPIHTWLRAIDSDLKPLNMSVLPSYASFLQCFDTVGWVIWPVKTCPRYDL